MLMWGERCGSEQFRLDLHTTTRAEERQMTYMKPKHAARAAEAWIELLHTDLRKCSELMSCQLMLALLMIVHHCNDVQVQQTV